MTYLMYSERHNPYSLLQTLFFTNIAITSPSFRVTLCLQFFSDASATSAHGSAASASTMAFAPHVIPLELNLRYLEQRIYGFGEMCWMTLPWPWPKATAVASISKMLLICTMKWDTLIWWLQNVVALLPQSCYNLSRFSRISIGNCYFSKFYLNVSDVYFQGRALFGHISAMVGLMKLLAQMQMTFQYVWDEIVFWKGFEMGKGRKLITPTKGLHAVKKVVNKQTMCKHGNFFFIFHSFQAIWWHGIIARSK